MLIQVFGLVNTNNLLLKTKFGSHLVASLSNMRQKNRIIIQRILLLMQRARLHQDIGKCIFMKQNFNKGVEWILKKMNLWFKDQTLRIHATRLLAILVFLLGTTLGFQSYLEDWLLLDRKLY